LSDATSDADSVVDSHGLSNSTIISTNLSAMSDAVSDVDSMADSNSINVSVADSKAVVGGGGPPIPAEVGLNVLLNAFRVAIAGALTKFNLIDGDMDAFVDESGVDVTASSGAIYFSVDDYFSPAIGDLWSDVLTVNWSNAAGWTVRQVVKATSTPFGGVGIKVTVEAGATEGLDIDHLAVVERDGETSNGTTTPTEFLFGGTSGVSVAGGETATSDVLEYLIEDDKDYLLIADIGDNAAADQARYTTTGGDGTYLKEATNSYNTQNLEDVALNDTQTRVFNKLGVEQNMVLVSESTEAEAVPDTVSVVLMEEDVDTITENTDLKAYASRDDGANWVQATLVDQGDYESGKRVLVGEADVSGQASDKTVRWKATTHNEKVVKLHGTGLLWS